METVANTVRVEAADVARVRRTVGVVAALETAIRIRSVVTRSEVARGTVVGRSSGVVGRAEVAAVAVPLIRAVASAGGNQTGDVVSVTAAVGEVAFACTFRISGVVFDTTIAAQRDGGLERIDSCIDERGAHRAVVAAPFFVATTVAAKGAEVAADLRRLARAVPRNRAQLVAVWERRLVEAVSTSVTAS